MPGTVYMTNFSGTKMSEDTMQEAVSRYLSFVQAFVDAYGQGEHLAEVQESLHPDQDSATVPTLAGKKQRPLLILCSPHPDDEILTGVLPLRLLREQGARVINLAVTLGSNQARQAERWAELLAACSVLGFDCQRLKVPEGFELKAGAEGDGWLTVIEGLASWFAQQGPDLVFLPHAHDAHPAHIATNHLVAGALAKWTASCQATVKAVETEYWSSMSGPNLLVGVSKEDLARLLTALTCHRGEISRNPYHLSHPARLMDAVRRGAELVHAPIPTRPGFLFAELYRLSVWRHGKNHSSAMANGWFGPSRGLTEILASSSAARVRARVS